MKPALFLSILLLASIVATPVLSSAQSKAPSFDVFFDSGLGCSSSNGFDDGPNLVGTTGCDNPAAAYYMGGHLVFQSTDFGSYALTFYSLKNSDGTYSLFGAPFSGPIVPYSVDGTWAIGGYNFIYHNGVFFDPTQGAQTNWSKVLTNKRGDAFVLGYAAAGFPTKKAFQPTGSGPLLAEFSYANNSIIYATYLSSLGFTGVPMIARDNGGNIFLADSTHVVKLTPVLPQKVGYNKTLSYGISSIAVDQYSQLYIGTGSSGIPVVNAPNPTPGGTLDSSIVVLSPRADRIIYSSYVGGDVESPLGVSVDSLGNASLGGTEQDWVWDGRYPGCPGIGYSNCAPRPYWATFGPLRRTTLPTQLNFRTHGIGTTTVLKLAFKNTGNVPVTVAGATISGAPFTLGNTCAGVVKPDATCMISVAFTPTSSGLQTGSLVVSSDSLDSPEFVQLSGIGK